MEALIVIALIIAVSNIVTNLSKNKQQQAKRPSARPTSVPVREEPPQRASMESRVRPTVMPTIDPGAPVTMSQTYGTGSAGMPEALRPESLEPERMRPEGMPQGLSTEGQEFHEAGFHTGDENRLGHVGLKGPDLGAQRKRENPQTAGNQNWTMPKEDFGGARTQSSGHARITPEQLRQAVIMKEILDAPRARRTGVRG